MPTQTETIYKEKAPKKIAVIIYTLLLAVLTFAWIPFNAHLSQANVRLALTAQDFANGDGLSRLIAENGYLHDFPLYSIILSFFPTFGVKPEFAIYLPAILAILGISFVAGFMASKSSGHLAGITAMSISILAFSTGLMLSPCLNTVLSTFLIFLGWSLWYRMSRIRNFNWIAVWTISLLPISVAFFASGAMSFIYFYTPLLLMKRPLKTRTRLVQVQHLIPLFLYLITLYTLWGQTFSLEALFFTTPIKDKSFWTFLAQLLVILTPWLFVGWPILCASFLAVEKTPIFNRYIRTLLVISALITLFIHSEKNLLSPLIAAFAVGGALNYEFFIRRYYLYLKRLTVLFFKLTIPLLCWNLLIISLHYSNLRSFPNLNRYDLIFTIAMSTTAIIIMYAIHKLRRKLLLFSCRLALIFSVFTGVVYSTITIGHQKYNYNLFSEEMTVIAKNAPVFTTLNSDYLKIFFYTRRRIQTIDKSQPLPMATGDIYFLSNEYPPIYAAYQWTNVIKTSTPQGAITLWKGQKKPEIVEPKNE